MAVPSTVSNDPINTVLVLFAMQAEARPFIEKIGLVQDDPPIIAPPSPAVSYSGTLGALQVHVVWNGHDDRHNVDYVGTVPASLTAYLAAQAFNPDLVISAGTAGGFKARGAVIGDVFVSSAKVNHDRRIPLPGFDVYGIGHIESTPTPRLQAELGLKLGVVSSGNSLDATDRCLEIMAEQGVAVKEMEAAAIAWVVCQLFGKPMFCIKAITDIVDGDRPTGEEFLENLHAAASALQEALPRVLKFVTGQRPSEL